VAYLFGKNLRQRAMSLLQIAHPNFRENLEMEIIKRFG
jgi:acyl-CoA hydrolase